MNAPSALPLHIGKYQVQAELGRGASGVVYRAVDAFKRRQVAIKQLHAHLLRQPEQAERYRKLLRNEVILTARLRHPNIVRLLDADEHAAQPYLVLEYVAGQPLSAFASADTLLPLAQVLDIAYKCCNALEHAQREGLVHRDIKPANVLLSEQGKSSSPTLALPWRCAVTPRNWQGWWARPRTCRPSRCRSRTWATTATCSRWRWWCMNC